MFRRNRVRGEREPQRQRRDFPTTNAPAPCRSRRPDPPGTEPKPPARRGSPPGSRRCRAAAPAVPPSRSGPGQPPRPECRPPRIRRQPGGRRQQPVAGRGDAPAVGFLRNRTTDAGPRRPGRHPDPGRATGRAESGLPHPPAIRPRLSGARRPPPRAGREAREHGRTRRRPRPEAPAPRPRLREEAGLSRSRRRRDAISRVRASLAAIRRGPKGRPAVEPPARGPIHEVRPRVPIGAPRKDEPREPATPPEPRAPRRPGSAWRAGGC